MGEDMSKLIIVTKKVQNVFVEHDCNGSEALRVCMSIYLGTCKKCGVSNEKVKEALQEYLKEYVSTPTFDEFMKNHP